MARDEYTEAVENILRDYYKKRWKLDHVISQAEKLNRDIEEINARIQQDIYIIRIPGLAGTNYEAVKASSHSNEGLERCMIELEDKIEKLKMEMAEKAQKRDSLEMKKRALEEEIAETGVELVLQIMTETEQQVLDQKFIYMRNFTGTGRELNMTEGAIRYWYQKALERFIDRIA